MNNTLITTDHNQAVRIKMAKATAKVKVDSPQDKRMKLLRGFQFVVYAWALRLSFVAVGSVLVSVFQLIAPSKSTGIRIEHIPITHWKSMIDDEYRGLSSMREPVLFTDVNVITPALLRSKLARVTPILSTKLKSSLIKEYVHYSTDRLWSARYKEQRTYAYITVDSYLQSPRELFQAHELLDTLRKTTQTTAVTATTIEATTTSTLSNTCTDNVCTSDLAPKQNPRYVYGTHNNALQYLPALSPDLAQYLSVLDESPQVCMWVSSPGVAAAMHYDLEDNLLLQISGTKQVVIVSPEALPALRPQTSLHPHWRQVTNSSQLYTSGQVLSYLNKFIDQSVQPKLRNDTNDKRDSFGEMKVYEVTLTPGVMVFIPAGYYHTVTTGAESLTVNAWFGSELSEVHTMMSNTPLPFYKTQSVQEKLNYLAAMLRVVLFRLRERGLSVSLFAITFAQRFENLMLPSSDTATKAVEWPIHDDSMLCSIEGIREIGKPYFYISF